MTHENEDERTDGTTNDKLADDVDDLSQQSSTKVIGELDDSDGIGVMGKVTGGGNALGVWGRVTTSDQLATGVYGTAEADSGLTYGVKGKTNSTRSLAAGVYGVADASSGEAIGVYSYVNSGDAYAFYTDDRSYFGGDVGIGTDSPATRLHVQDSVSGGATAANHVAFLENTAGGGSADVLALQIDEAASDIGGTNNYITFKASGGNNIGAIEGTGGGVELKSGSGDYAEYLPRLDPDESIAPGDVVGVVDGAVTKRTDDADQALVVSDRSIVTGNAPIEQSEDRDRYESCAFVGQVPVAVHGPICDGAIIVPSGDHDGTGRAIAPEDYRLGDGPLVGRAWESSDEDGLTEVIVAVGLETGEALDAALAAQQETTDEQRETIEEQQATIESLRERLAALEDRVSAVEAGRGTEPATADD
jgi:uncharacterized coiled-coil protein SlyX